MLPNTTSSMSGPDCFLLQLSRGTGQPDLTEQVKLAEQPSLTVRSLAGDMDISGLTAEGSLDKLGNDNSYL